MLAPFSSKDFNGQLQRSLGKVYLGAASVGEVAATAESIRDGDLDSWHQAWKGLAENLEERADSAQQAGQGVSAAGLYLRATEAYRQATFFHRVDLDCQELQSIWPRTERCCQAALELSGRPSQSFHIPFEGRSLYATLVLPASSGGPWKTLIAPSGYDSCVEEMILMFGLSALARGYAILAIDGPGQGKTLYDPKTRAYMRPDFEVPMRAILDFACSIPEINPARMAAIGCSFGGYLVPRGIAGDARVSAMVADPGQFDMSAALLSRLPPNLLALLHVDSPEAEAAFSQLAQSPEGQLMFGPRMAVHGKSSVQAYCQHMTLFHNRDHAAQISCPSLICDNEIDPVATGQGHALAKAMTNAPVEFVRFTAAEGAGGHCEGAGREIFDERVFAWLDKTLKD